MVDEQQDAGSGAGAGPGAGGEPSGGSPGPQAGSHGEYGWDATSGGAGPAGGWQSTPAAGTTYGGEDHPRTTLAFVLSLVALVFVVLLFWLVIPPLLAIPMAIVGIVFGGQARRDMRAQPDRYRNHGLATAAVILGWITLGLIVLGILLIVLVIAIFSVSFGELWSDPQFQQEFLDEIQRQSLRWPG